MAGRSRGRLLLAGLVVLVLSPPDAFDDEFHSLGRLKANQGNQNYEIDAGTRLGRYRGVVIWCRRFAYAFGAGELAPAR